MMTDEGVRTCDMCDDAVTEATPVTFSWNGGGWVADLCDGHATHFFDSVKPFVDVARVDSDFVNTNIEAPEGYTIVPAHRKRSGVRVKPTLKRKTPAKCPICQRKFVAFNGLSAHVHKVHAEAEIRKIGWQRRITYDEYLKRWPELDNTNSSISVAGLISKKPRR